MVETDILPALQRAADWLVDSPLNAVFALVVAVVSSTQHCSLAVADARHRSSRM
jgi:hypothetical protein